MAEYYFDVPVFGRVACVIRAKNKREAVERFEAGDFGDVMHSEFKQLLTPADRKWLAKNLETQR